MVNASAGPCVSGQEGMDSWSEWASDNVTITGCEGQNELTTLPAHHSDPAVASFKQGLMQAVLVSYIPTCVVGVIGNGLVIFIIGYYSQIRARAYNLYIWNLAFADLFFTLTLPFFCYATFTGNWLFGDFVCKLAHVLRETNKYASVFTLAALSVDRYLASYYDLDRWRTKRIGIGVCVMVWVFCSSISVPFWMFARTAPSKNGTVHYCRPFWPTEHLAFFVTFWALFQLIVGLIVPMIVIIASYILLAVRLNRMMRESSAKSASSTRKVARPSRKMTKTVLIVVLTFLFCQTPYFAVEIISWRTYEKITKYKQLPTDREKMEFVILNTVAQILVFVSSCCNPIIYGLTNPDYRKLYLDLLCRRKGNASSNRNLTSVTGTSRVRSFFESRRGSGAANRKRSAAAGDQTGDTSKRQQNDAICYHPANKEPLDSDVHG